MKYKMIIRALQRLYLLVRDCPFLYRLLLELKCRFSNTLELCDYELQSVKEYCKEQGEIYICKEEEQYRRVYIPEYWEFEKQGEIEQYISPEVYVAELHNAIVVGGNSFVLVEDRCLFDMAVGTDSERYDLRSGSVRSMNKNSVCIMQKKNNMELEEAISLVGVAADNYYHLTIELLSRLIYIDKETEWKRIPLLVDEAITKTEQYKEMLQMLNNGKRPIITVQEHQPCHVKRLIYPSYLMWMPINLKKGSLLTNKEFLMAQSALLFLREKSALNIKRVGLRNIFISRENAVNSRLVNELEVAEVFREAGFEIIFPEKMSFEEQKKMFNEAKCIVGTSGAAFTNMIFCNLNTLIVNIVPEKYHYYGYATMAYLLGYRMLFLDAEVNKRETNIALEQYKLSVDYCKRFLSAYNKGQFDVEEIQNDATS